MNPTLQDLIELALHAGDILRAGYGKEQHVTHKGVIDLVTEYDHQSETFLLGEIRQRFPGHSLNAEESGLSGTSQAQVWYVDPLDGTVNFAHGVPIFCVSLAYVEAGQVQLGVVFDPMRQECFSAERGKGAWLGERRLQVTRANRLIQSLLVTGFPYDVATNPRNNLPEYARLAVRSQGVRRLGSAALDLCYVAAGRFDGYWELHLNPWDLAAGMLIAAEAGAKVERLWGEGDMLVPPCSVLACTPGIHAELLEALASK
ncbi:MAG: inositol monophosphatase [Anaerolineales bacterium]|nr:inositol monophosphatase [Anaerolineales bacterium]